ncbi:MAG: hypothetical protein SGJ11_06685 [Phycisphaerae bacterium]|nr:hypothetical protein [Phycisphaerae bacterium]
MSFLNRKLHPRTRAIGLVAAAAVVLWLKPMGLLFWARIRILTNIPRTAMADEQPSGDLAWSPFVPAAPVLEPIALPLLPSRNPFVQSGNSPATGRDTSTSPHTSTSIDASGRSGDEDGAKSGGDPADHALTEQSHESAQTEAAPAPPDCRLQGLVSGLPIAVIDGRMYRVGDTIASLDESEPFTLVEIKDTSVLLERAGRVYEIRVGAPRQRRSQDFR